MPIPGFTAEAALGRAGQPYRTAARAAPSAQAVQPAQSLPIITGSLADLFRQRLVQLLQGGLTAALCNRACWQQLYRPCVLDCHFDPYPRWCRQHCCQTANDLCCAPGGRLICPDEIPIGG